LGEAILISRRRLLHVAASGTALTLLGGCPLMSRLPGPDKLPVVGMLDPGLEMGTFEQVFQDALAALGWVDGQTIRLEFRLGADNPDVIARQAPELVNLPADMLVTGGFATQIAIRDTTTIPIVFESVVDPVAQGMVASLGHPGGNVTGVSLTTMIEKQVEFSRTFCHSCDACWLWQTQLSQARPLRCSKPRAPRTLWA
jgi:putative ABC transport system substrate-binding protein